MDMQHAVDAIFGDIDPLAAFDEPTASAVPFEMTFADKIDDIADKAAADGYDPDDVEKLRHAYKNGVFLTPRNLESLMRATELIREKTGHNDDVYMALYLIDLVMNDAFGLRPE